MSVWSGEVEGRIEVQVVSVRVEGAQVYATVQVRLLDEQGTPLAALCEREIRVGRDAWVLGFGPVRIGVSLN